MATIQNIEVEKFNKYFESKIEREKNIWRLTTLNIEIGRVQYGKLLDYSFLDFSKNLGPYEVSTMPLYLFFVGVCTMDECVKWFPSLLGGMIWD